MFARMAGLLVVLADWGAVALLADESPSNCRLDCYTVDSAVVHADRIGFIAARLETGLVSGGDEGTRRAPRLVSGWITPQASQTMSFGFTMDAVGGPPAGFEFARTGGGAPGAWVVREDPSSPGNRILIQESADPTDYRFPLAIVQKGSFRDVTLSVRAKSVSGKVDQGFGVVWRYRDAGNYYITRCNADENNCTIYHTVNGQRRAFQNKAIKVTKGTWHTLRLQATGRHFIVWFDGGKVLDATDGTFSDAGQVGLWTKADSVIQFDDFTIEGH